jgi:hypothetical protein
MKKSAGIKAYTFPFLGSEWTIQFEAFPDDKPYHGLSSYESKTILINTDFGKHVADTILHELLEIAAHTRGYRYENGEGIVFVLDHKQFTGLVEDCSEVYLSICKQLKL